MKPLLVVQVGDPVPEVLEARGPFHVWITRRMGLDPEDAAVVDPRTGQELPDPLDHSGVVVTGSSSLVTDREPWSERTASWLGSVIDTETPFLGICYGHQLVAHGLGGRAGRNPRGREIGSIRVTLTEAAAADPLFSALPSPVHMQATHVESVLELPPGAVLLGHNDADAHQAFRLGPCGWCTQFHPEFDAFVVSGYIRARADAVRAEGLDPDALIAAAVDADHGRMLLTRFRQLLRS